MARRRADLHRVVGRIIGLSPKMRFVGVIDLRGRIVEGIMKEGKQSLESQREQEHFCKQVAERRKMRKEFDRSLGRVMYVHVEREKVSQLVIYTPRHTIFVTMEPDLGVARKIQMVAKIKRIIASVG